MLGIIAKVALAVSIILPMWGIVSFINETYHVTADVDSVMHRAQVAADADDMLSYMQTLKANLEKHDMIRGYSVPIFQTPANDLSLLYESVNKIISRLEKIKDLSRSDTAYQVGLDDLRGTIRELERPSGSTVFTRFIPLIGIVIVTWFVTGVIRAYEQNRDYRGF